MPTLMQRLRQLDRRVLREDRLNTGDGWTTAMSKWRWALAGAGVNAIIAAAILTLSSNRWLGLILMPSLLMTAFQAGAMKTEYDRLSGTGTVLGKRRPEGL